MAKYQRSGVTLRDVAAALPLLPGGLLWRISLYPRPQNSTTLSPSVEMCYVGLDGSTVVVKRWPGSGRTGSTEEIIASLLIAAQQAHNYVDGVNGEELMRKILWDLGVPIRA